MLIVEMKVTAYVREDMDVRIAVQEFLLDEDWVSYCDVDVESEEKTDKTFPEDDGNGGEVTEEKPTSPETEHRKMEQWDLVDNAIFDLIEELNPSLTLKIEWTTDGVAETRAEIREALARLYCEKLKLCTEDEFYP